MELKKMRRESNIEVTLFKGIIFLWIKIQKANIISLY
jgi:hypothetical protein